jgi:catechol 2,3-dioxygenase-like lactoylglutathione lyase family enzyme
MKLTPRFVHVNIVARDWRQLADFYEQVLGCKRVPPQRDLRGPWLEEGTGVPGAEIQGVHLRLPGYGGDGPTLEIFQYSPQADRPEMAVNCPGLVHVAFAVSDVQRARDTVLAAGGRAVGKVVSLPVQGQGAGTVTFAYVTDPEGNIIELQRWSQ